MGDRKHNSRYNQHKKPITRLLMPAIKILALASIFGLIVWGIIKSNPVEFLTVNIHWDIDQHQAISPNLLADKIKPLISNKYQLLDLPAIKHTLELGAWIDSADIHRLFWNTIKIKVKAHKIAMRWQNVNCKNKEPADCKGYVSNKGVLFVPEKLITSNAVLLISKPDKSIVAKLYQDYQHYQTIAKPMSIASFSKTNIDQLSFKSGVTVILGYQQQTERLKRFIKAYNKLKGRNSKIKRATFDMRYPKGFALRKPLH